MPFQLDVTDMRNVLDLVASPCLLVNVESSQIETGNYLFANISGYSLDEIRNVSLCTLLSGLNLQSVTDGGSTQSQLIRKQAEPLPVELKFRFIGSTGNQILICLEDKSDQTGINFEEITIQLIDLLHELPSIKMAGLFEKTIKILIESKFADDAAIYAIIDSQHTFLSRFGLVDHTSLPLEIPALELERITQMDIWQPGRRVLSEIHRAGRDNKFLCVYSLPVLEKEKARCILVFGYQSESYNEQRGNSIQQMGRLISTIINFSNDYFNFLEDASNLSSSLEKYSAGFENSIEGILVIDQSNNILDFNTPFTQLFHYTPVEIKNKDLSRLFGQSGATEIIKFTNDSSNQTKKRSFSLVDRKGNERFLEVTHIPLKDEQTDQRMLFFHDISEIENQTKLIERLEKQAALGETLAEFAHDARNIINRQTTGIQLLAKKLQLPSEGNEEILSLLEECDNLSDMMESVLSFSRQDLGEFEVIDLGEFIQRVVYRNKYKAEKAGVDVRFNNRLEGSEIFGYQRSLERVLLNLINNAIDATRQDNGTVSITLLSEESDPSQAVVKISDTGPGIPENITKVLLSNQFTDKASGTGLGLLISNKIIEAHRGQLTIESFSGGTIFSIFLPLLEQGEEN
jgi:PAS domain S-box-containing protein